MSITAVYFLSPVILLNIIPTVFNDCVRKPGQTTTAEPSDIVRRGVLLRGVTTRTTVRTFTEADSTAAATGWRLYRRPKLILCASCMLTSP